MKKEDILKAIEDEIELADLNFERNINKEFNYGRSTGLQWAKNIIIDAVLGDKE